MRGRARACTAELLDIHARTGKTIVFVSHDLDESVLLADRVVAMLPDPGRLHTVLDTRLDPALSLDERRRFGGVQRYAAHELLQSDPRRR